MSPVVLRAVHRVPARSDRRSVNDVKHPRGKSACDSDIMSIVIVGVASFGAVIY